MQPMKTVLIAQRPGDMLDVMAQWLRDAGFRMRVCGGPSEKHYDCWADEYDDCPLWGQADLVIYDPWLATAYQGEPGAVLLEYIRRRHIDLVVMGTHGRTPAERWLLGSVAHDVVYGSPAPVLLVSRKGHFHGDDQLRVLVAYDGSEPARAALDASLALAAAVPVSLTLFLVLPGARRDSQSARIEWYEEPVLGAPPDLEYAAAELAKRGMSCRRAYSFGDAAEEILKFTQRGDFDLVAIGTHSRSGFDRLVTGSVADQVTRQAHVPVLIATGLTRTARRDGSQDAGRTVPA
jgi:nucleotide-binding universal stress UspA family protein